MRARRHPMMAALAMSRIDACTLAGGDDYELCFTAPRTHNLPCARPPPRRACPVTCIGRIEAERGVRVMAPGGQQLPLRFAGFDAFRLRRAATHRPPRVFSTSTIPAMEPITPMCSPSASRPHCRQRRLHCLRHAHCARAPHRALHAAHPAHLIALGFGSGLGRIAPGTVGTLWAWLAFLVLQLWLTPARMGGSIAASLVGGWWACTVTARHLRVADPGHIVWDEVVAMWIVLVAGHADGLWGQLVRLCPVPLF